MVARLLFDSVNLAQKPKSAEKGRTPLAMTSHTNIGSKLTNLDISNTVKEDVVTLDITVNDVLTVQVGQTLASLNEK